MRKKYKKDFFSLRENMMLDQYGNGESIYCGWYNNMIGDNNEKMVIYGELLCVSITINK